VVQLVSELCSTPSSTIREEGITVATQTITLLKDDLDGSDASQTVTFGLDQVSYEIDLSDENASKLRDALSGYVSHARKVRGSRDGRRRSSRSGSGEADLTTIREWARGQGLNVSDRGRISKEIRDAYAAGH
jgi:nucleoid-associated protein Lsr2